MESTSALSQAKASFTDFRTRIKISQTILPLYSHVFPLSVSTTDLEYLKANAALSSRCFLRTSACDVFTINTYKDEVTVPPPPSVVVHTGQDLPLLLGQNIREWPSGN